MDADKARGKPIGRPKTPSHVIRKAQKLAAETEMSINQIKK